MSKIFNYGLMLSLASTTCVNTAFANSREDRTAHDDHTWEISASIDYGLGESPLVGSPEQSQRVQESIYLHYYGERFFVDDEIGYSLFENEQVMVNLVSGPSEDYFLFDKDFFDLNRPELQGLKKRRFNMNGGIEVLFDNPYGEFEFQLETDLARLHKGQSIFLNYGLSFANKNWELRPQIGAVWKSQKYVDYYYGVSADEVTEDRPFYRGTASLDWTALLEARYGLTREWKMVGIFYYEKGGAGIVDSPIVAKDHYLQYSIGVEWSRPFSVNF